MNPPDPSMDPSTVSRSVRPRLRDRLLLALLRRLPQHVLSAAMHRLARWRWPPAKKALIRFVVRRYGIDTSEAAEPDLDGYPSFNAFFTRALRPDARPFDPTPGALLCPVDGRISQIGRIRADRLLQAKGVDYSLRELLAGDAELARDFVDGHFATLYLSPRDYHRVHQPADGALRRMDFVPGDLFSVNATSVLLLPGLFTRNERVVCVFDGARGPFAVILVGAIFVGSMETVWHGEVRARTPGGVDRWDYAGEPPIRLEAGAELGRFNMGSTVILLFPPGTVAWHDELQAGAAVRLGQGLGRFLEGNSG